MKSLWIGMLVVSPAVVYWVEWIDRLDEARRLHESAYSSAPSHSAAESVVSIPVEVIATGKAPEWIYVQVANQGVPRRD